MGTFKFGRKKNKLNKSRKNSQETDKDSLADTPNSKAASSKSAPDGSKTSPLKHKSTHKDVGNVTEPILSQSSSSTLTRNHGTNGVSKGPIMPEITSIKSHRTSNERPRSLFRSSKSKHGGASESDDETSPRFNSQEPALLSLPLFRTSSHGSEAIQNDPLAESSPSQLKVNTKPNGGSSKKGSTVASEIDTPTEVEAHMANTDSTLKTSVLNPEANNSGIFSTFMSAAHNAASHIGNIASAPPEEFKSHPPAENGGVNNENNGTSFMQHLDSLLFAQSKNKSKENSSEPSQNQQGTDDDGLSVGSGAQSIAHDVVFQPIRNNALSTMGKGELTLEALGITDASLRPERNSIPNQVPVISVDSADGKRLSHYSISGASRDFDEGSNGAAISKVVSGPSALGRSPPPVTTTDTNGNGVTSMNNGNTRDLSAKSRDQSFENLRSSSPISTFRRSMSPSHLKISKSSSAVPTQDTLAIARRALHRRSASSGTEPPPSNGLDATTSHSTESDNGSLAGSPMSASFNTPELKDFTYASQKRNKEFHSIFKKIPKDERLIDDYSCALQREILVQGRLYITLKHICFNSNILGWITNFHIPIQEIVQLEKKNTAGVFPNAIVIQTLHQRYIFASFLVRDATFDLVTNIWVKLVRGPTAGNVDVPVDLDNDHFQSGSDSDYDTEDGYSSDDDFDVDNDSSNDTSADFGPQQHSPTEIDHKEVSGETKIKDEIIDAPLGKVFNALFGDDTALFKKVLETQKNKNISTIPKFTENSRKYSYIKPLNGPVGPKETSCQVSETIDHKDFESYILVTQITKTPDVPSGGSFSTNTQIYLSWGSKNSTKITVYTSIQWTAKSWIKSAVEKGSVEGQKDSMNIMLQELKSYLADSNDFEGSDSVGDELVSSLPSIGPPEHAPTENGYKKAAGDTKITDENFNAPLGTIYSILFGDDSSYIKSVLEAQKNFDISTIPKFESDGGVKQRKYQYTKPLNGPIGPKQTKCLITETIDHFDINNYIMITQTTQSPDVPSGNSFTVQTRFYFSWGPNNTTNLFVVTTVLWTGKSWVKGPIEKGSIEGQNESIGIMVAEVKNVLSNATTGKKSKKRGRTKSKAEPVKGTNDNQTNSSTSSNNLLDFFNQLQSPYSLGVLVFVAILVFFILKSVLSPSDRSTISIDQVQKITIGGHEYMILPSVEDSLQRKSLREETEFEVWKWINERTKAEALQRDHKHQDLSEMVNLAEQHLRVLKEHISHGGENKHSEIL